MRHTVAKVLPLVVALQLLLGMVAIPAVDHDKPQTLVMASSVKPASVIRQELIEAQKAEEQRQTIAAAEVQANELARQQRIEQAAARASRASRAVTPTTTAPSPDLGPLDVPHSFACKSKSGPSDLAIDHGHEVAASKWGEDQWQYLYELWSEESGWNPDNKNCSSGACGIPQFYPCSKLRSTSIRGQIAQGVEYIEARYGTPQNALATKHSKGGY